MENDEARMMKYGDKITITFPHGGSIQGRFDHYYMGVIYYDPREMSPPGQHARSAWVAKGWR